MRRRQVLMSGLLVGLLGLTGAPPSATAASNTYHVDCWGGNDAASGTSASQAWRSMGKANQAWLQPGDRLLFKRDCSWTGPLNARWHGTQAAPITIGAYGSGALPRIEKAREGVVVTGTHLIFEHLFVRSSPPSYDGGCENQPQGQTAGFRFMSGSAHNVVRYSEARESNIGIWLGPGSHHIKVLHNVLRDNNVKDIDPNSDGGAVAVGVHGDNNEIAYNVISGSVACSRQHGRDGAAFDIYGGRYNDLHHNRSIENHTFVEVGHSRASDNTLAYNMVTSTLKGANLAVVRGAKDARWGPTYRTRLYNNSAYLTGAESMAVVCFFGCTPDIMTFKNNIVWARDMVGYVDATWDEGHNIWWSPGGPKIWFPKSASSKTVDPRFVDAAGGDLHLAAGSPAIDAGTLASVNNGYASDLDGGVVPRGAGVDIGAFESGGGASIVPPPPPPPVPSATIARDQFSRTAAGGWGASLTGGAWAPWWPSGDFSVNGTEGAVRASGPGQLRSVFLPSVNAHDVDAVFRVRTSVAPTADGQYVYFVARQTGLSNEYRGSLRFASGGGVYVYASRVVNNAETALQEPVFVGNLQPASRHVWVRVRVVGAHPTTLRIKAWADGTAEPESWQFTATDGTSSLQGAGVLGLRTYVSSRAASGAVVFSFDDLTATAP